MFVRYSTAEKFCPYDTTFFNHFFGQVCIVGRVNFIKPMTHHTNSWQAISYSRLMGNAIQLAKRIQLCLNTNAASPKCCTKSLARTSPNLWYLCKCQLVNQIIAHLLLFTSSYKRKNKYQLACNNLQFCSPVLRTAFFCAVICNRYSGTKTFKRQAFDVDTLANQVGHHCL